MKYLTLNNNICKQIIRCLALKNMRTVFFMLYNCSVMDIVTPFLMRRLLLIISDARGYNDLPDVFSDLMYYVDDVLVRYHVMNLFRKEVFL